MCRKLICLISLVLVLGLAGNSSGQTGSILIEWWTNISGNLPDLLNDPNYPDNPTGREYLSSFEVPASGSKPPELEDLVDNYGARVRGYFHPPVTADYTFWMVSDDNGYLYLSPEGSSDGKVLIARVIRWSGFDEWDKYVGQKSNPIRLEAGKKYYIEAVYKEGGGGDHLRVAYGPAGAQVVIPGSELSPWDLGMATDPDPAAGSLLDEDATQLRWSAGPGAVEHDVYFGTDAAEVAAGTGDTAKGRQTDTVYVASDLVVDTTYYWRIDEVEDDGTVHTGEVWSFTVKPPTAIDPSPADGARNVAREVQLSWTKGFGTVFHHVYFGENSADVEAGTPDTYKGAVVEPTYAIADLAENTMYYWRVDAFDGTDTHTGDLWSFKTTPGVHDPNLVAWWKMDDEGTGTVIDYSGHGRHGSIHGNALFGDGVDGGALEFYDHANEYVTIDDYTGILGNHAFSITAWIRTHDGSGEIAGWGSTPGGTSRVEFRINGDRLRCESAGNVQGDTSLPNNEWFHAAVTVKPDATISYPDVKLYLNAVDDTRDTTDPSPLNMASGYPVTIGRRHSGDERWFFGAFDDVRIYDKELTQAEIQQIMLRPDPFRAWGPDPAHGATPDIEHVTSLSWSPGDDATQHDVYFGTDQYAVADADASDTTGVYQGQQATTVYTPSEAFEWDQDYYWRIDEHSVSGAVTKGRVWSFAVADFLVVDDFEDYNDLTPDRLWQTWLDGFGYNEPPPGYAGNGTGSRVGNDDPPFTEQGTVHSGLQAMRFRYTNDGSTGKALYSETEREWAVPQDWTRKEVKALVLWFYGDPANSAEPLYVAVQDSLGTIKAVSHDDPAALRRGSWQEWNIDLREFSNAGVNLASVKKVYIGVGNRNNPQAGGTGTLFFDDIRLYRIRCVPTVLKPEADLTNDCLVDHLDLEVLTNNWLRTVWDPTGGHDGGGSLTFGASSDYVAIEDLSYESAGHRRVSVCAWIRTDSESDQYIVSFDRNEYYRLEINGSGAGAGQVGWDVWTDAGQSDYGSVTRVDDDQWHHVVGVFDSGTSTIYIDGIAEPSVTVGTTFGSGDEPRFGFLGANSEATEFDWPTPGGNPIQHLDDVRIYDDALSAGDIMALANGTGQPAIGPILWYKLDETAGQLAQDSSGNGYDGHLRFTWFDINMHDDNRIDLKDYALVVDGWLDELLWPQP